MACPSQVQSYELKSHLTIYSFKGMKTVYSNAISFTIGCAWRFE